VLKPDDNNKIMPTILHLIDTTGPGGAETVFIQLADKLRDLGYRSIVVIRGEGWVNDQLRERQLQPIIIPAKGSFEVNFLKQLISIIKTQKVDLIQSHLLGSNVYGAIAGIFTQTPVVATYHGMVDISSNERFRLLKHWFMKLGIQRYIAVSQQLGKTIEQKGLLDIRKTRVIYNGVDLNRFSRLFPKTLKQALKLPDNAVMIGSLGNIRPAKAYDNLISAGAQVVKNYPEAHFVIAGHQRPSLMKQLEQQIRELNVSNHFHFIGFQNDSVTFLKQMDLFALSSSSEGFSIATIEAMAAQLPIVVTRCGGPEEIVTPGYDALMVDANNPKALAEGIESLLSQPDLRQKLANNALKTVTQRFSLEAMLQSYRSEYQQLICR
jgi:glycosyltransferase involved in cell wall biosynthesis